MPPYENGVLRLDHPLPLAESARVAGIVISATAAATACLLPEDQFQAELDALDLDVPLLPADFSRADVYTDHD